MTITAVRPVASRTMGDVEILDRKDVAALLGVLPKTVNEYRLRYRTTSNPFPEPDGYVGRSPYWKAARADEIRQWDAARPGRGNPTPK